MDYKSLISLAEKNQELKDSNNEFLIKRKANGGQTSGPNKSVIDAFKARKQREEMEKQRERQREKERLLALRAQNSKSVKKAKMMETRTKDNDFSRIVLTEEQIEEQKRVEEKLRRKGTKDITHNKQSMNELEDKLVRNGGKKQRKSKNSQQNSGLNTKSDKYLDKNKDNNNMNNKSNNNNNENKIKSRTPKPAMSYEQLLCLATEKAKTEKISLTEELMSEVEEKKQLRPMTQREKDRLKEEMYYKQRAHKGLARLPSAEQIKKNSNSGDNRNDFSKKANSKSDLNNSKYNNNNKVIPKTVNNSNIYNQTQQKSDKNIKTNNSIVTNERPNERSRVPPLNRQDSRRMGQMSGSTANKSAIISKMNNRLNTRDKEYNEKYSNASKERLKAPNNEFRGGNRSINERTRPPSPPPARRPISPSPPPTRRPMPPSPPPARRPMPPSPPPTRRPMPPMPKLPPIGSTYRRGMYEDVSQYVDDDYEEEDSDDMSDFIDDGPEEKPIEEDYSRAIREIFGYDKRKYRNVDDDDIEEANFAQCMREEVRSTRIGIQEDLEEERKEEEEKRLKALAKKRLNR